MKAMIFAAGLGTRLKPFTENHPKALAEVNGKSLLERNISYLKSYGFRDLVINVHHFPDQIIDFLKQKNSFDLNISISDESDALLETGGGLKKASQYLEGSDPFLVMNVDILTNLDLLKMVNYHKSHNALATLAVTRRDTSRYFLFDASDKLCGWKNIKTGEERIMDAAKNLTKKAFSGIHILEPTIFQKMHQEGKFSIVDVYLKLCNEELIMGYDHSDDIFIDVGKPEAVDKAGKLFP